MDSIVKDLRYGMRALARRPGFTAAAVVRFALGIGANTVLFSVVNSALRPLSYPNPDRPVMAWELRPQMYIPYFQAPRRNAALTIRSAVDPESLAPAARAAIREVDGARPICAVRRMEEIVSGSIAPERYQMGLVASFVALALLLASVGIFVVMSFAVAPALFLWVVALLAYCLPALRATRVDTMLALRCE